SGSGGSMNAQSSTSNSNVSAATSVDDGSGQTAIPLQIAGVEDGGGTSGAQETSVVKTEDPQSSNYTVQLLTLGIVGLLALGIVAQTLMFRRHLLRC
ncbi:MAG: hypothetical protein ACOYIK_08910, partial [Coriobacteriales bacterium]